MNIYDMYYNHPIIDDCIIGLESCINDLDYLIPSSDQMDYEEYNEAFEALTGYRDDELTDEEFEYVLESVFGPDLTEEEIDYLIAEEGILGKLADKLSSASKKAGERFEKKKAREREDTKDAINNKRRANEIYEKSKEILKDTPGTTFGSFKTTRRIKNGLGKLVKKAGNADKKLDEKIDNMKAPGAVKTGVKATKDVTQAVGAVGGALGLTAGAFVADSKVDDAKHGIANKVRDAINGYNNPGGRSSRLFNKYISDIKKSLKSGIEYDKKGISHKITPKRREWLEKVLADFENENRVKNPSGVEKLVQGIAGKAKTKAQARLLNGETGVREKVDRAITHSKISDTIADKIDAAGGMFPLFSAAGKATKALVGPEAKVAGRAAIRKMAATQSAKNQVKRYEKLKNQKEGRLQSGLSKAAARVEHYDKKVEELTKSAKEKAKNALNKLSRTSSTATKERAAEESAMQCRYIENRLRTKVAENEYRARMMEQGEIVQEGFLKTLGESAMQHKQKKMLKAGEKAKQFQLKADEVRQKNEMKFLKEEAKLNKRIARHYYDDNPEQLKLDKAAIQSKKFNTEAKAKKMENAYRKNLALASGSKKTFSDTLVKLGGVTPYSDGPITNASGNYFPQPAATLGAIAISSAEAQRRMDNNFMQSATMQNNLLRNMMFNQTSFI